MVSCSKARRSSSEHFRYWCSLLCWCRLAREVGRDVVVVLHGFPASSANWEKLIREELHCCVSSNAEPTGFSSLVGHPNSLG